MEEKLAGKDYLFIGSMLFGLFFGAGNLIFPIHMGQEAVWPAGLRNTTGRPFIDEHRRGGLLGDYSSCLLHLAYVPCGCFHGWERE